MPEIQLPAIRLYYEERGTGAPILLSHGTGSDADTWGSAFEELARLGRIIAYDRRGFTRSERPEPYLRTTPAEHAGDAAALLDGLGATPAIVIGRSYGGDMALNLALRYPRHVRALVLLEGGDVFLSEALPELSDFLDQLTARIRTAVAERGMAAAGEALMRAVLGDDGYEGVPEDRKARVTANGPAIVAEIEGYRDDLPDPTRLRAITCPALVVAAMSSPPPFRDAMEILAATLPNARLAVVEGGHMINPADPQVVNFIQEVVVGA
ncbi:MAG: alpha/beta fold hydrolase [Vicinamibacterales bacterium]